MGNVSSILKKKSLIRLLGQRYILWVMSVCQKIDQNFWSEVSSQVGQGWGPTQIGWLVEMGGTSDWWKSVCTRPCSYASKAPRIYGFSSKILWDMGFSAPITYPRLVKRSSINRRILQVTWAFKYVGQGRSFDHPLFSCLRSTWFSQKFQHWLRHSCAFGHKMRNGSSLILSYDKMCDWPNDRTDGRAQVIEVLNAPWELTYMLHYLRHDTILYVRVTGFWYKYDDGNPSSPQSFSWEYIAEVSPSSCVLLVNTLPAY